MKFIDPLVNLPDVKHPVLGSTNKHVKIARTRPFNASFKLNFSLFIIYPLRVKKFKKRDNLRVMLLQFLIATLLNIALPPIVTPAIIADTIDATNIFRKLLLKVESFSVMAAPAAPDRIPHMSPKTSLQMELTLSACLISIMACLLPFIFLLAMAVKGSISHEATASPKMSNSILKPTKTTITSADNMMVALVRASSLIMLNTNDKTSAIKKTSNGHSQTFGFLLIGVKFLFIIVSILLSNSKAILRVNFAALGLVGFPNHALYRYQYSGFPLSETCTKSPLRPHHNPRNISVEQPRRFP